MSQQNFHTMTLLMNNFSHDRIDKKILAVTSHLSEDDNHKPLRIFREVKE